MLSKCVPLILLNEAAGHARLKSSSAGTFKPGCLRDSFYRNGGITMLENIDVSRMNRLMKENRDARKIIAQLLENHRTEVSMIAHEIRNPLTLVSSSLQIMEAQHPEVKEFHNWSQTVEDVRFMCDLLNDLSSFNNSRTLHYSVFPIRKLLKNIALSFAMSLGACGSGTEFTSRISPDMGEFTGDKVKLEQLVTQTCTGSGVVNETAGPYLTGKLQDGNDSIYLTEEEVSLLTKYRNAGESERLVIRKVLDL